MEMEMAEGNDRKRDREGGGVCVCARSGRRNPMEEHEGK